MGAELGEFDATGRPPRGGHGKARQRQAAEPGAAGAASQPARSCLLGPAPPSLEPRWARARAQERGKGERLVRLTGVNGENACCTGLQRRPARRPTDARARGTDVGVDTSERALVASVELCGAAEPLRGAAVPGWRGLDHAHKS